MWVDRLESTIESHQMAAAQVREARGIPGTSVRTTWLCRDKPSMKEALRQAGVPTAASRGRRHAPTRRGTSPDAIGFPLILKPRAGAGALGTTRVDSMAELAPGAGRVRRTPTRSPSRSSSRATRASTTRSPSTATSSTTGSRTTTRTCSRRCGTAGSRRSSSPPTGSTTPPFYDEVREMGARVIEALGIGTSATHMEWFYGPKGLRFSEIGCRPPGVGAWDLYSAANDVDVYREWAHAHRARLGPDRPMSRRVLRRHRRAAPRPATARSRATAASTRSSGALRRLDHRRAPARHRHAAPSRSRPATWPTPGSGCSHPDYDTLRGDARRRRAHRPRVRRMTARRPLG